MTSTEINKEATETSEDSSEEVVSTVDSSVEEDTVEESVVDSSDEIESSSDVDDSRFNWYIVQSLSNHEYRVLKRIQFLIDEGTFEGRLNRALVPEQQVVEIKNNKRIEKKVKIFPGYVFVQMEADDALAFEIRRLPGVAKFIGTGHGLTPVQEEEILKVLRKVGDKTKQIDVDFEVGESIKIVDGPFRGYAGQISDINAVKGLIKAKISIFGRETPVELSFSQVEKTV